MMTCFICWIVNRGLTQWIGLLVVTTPNLRAMNVLTQNWEGENNWVHPPASQICRVITHMRAGKAVGT